MLEKSFIIALVVFGVYCIMMPGMIFGVIQEWAKKWPEWVQKPVYNCCICMVFWWGTPFYWVLWGNSFFEWVVVILCGTGINGMISFFFISSDDT